MRQRPSELPRRCRELIDGENIRISPSSRRRLARKHQVLRRSFSTLAQKYGTVKDIQRQMRHSKPDVTAGEYMQVIPESVRVMVSGMYAEMMKRTTSGTVQ